MTSFTLSKILSSSVSSATSESKFSIVFSNEYLSKSKNDDGRDLDRLEILKNEVITNDLHHFLSIVMGNDIRDCTGTSEEHSSLKLSVYSTFISKPKMQRTLKL